MCACRHGRHPKACHVFGPDQTIVKNFKIKVGSLEVRWIVYPKRPLPIRFSDWNSTTIPEISTIIETVNCFAVCEEFGGHTLSHYCSTNFEEAEKVRTNTLMQYAVSYEAFKEQKNQIRRQMAGKHKLFLPHIPF